MGVYLWIMGVPSGCVLTEIVKEDMCIGFDEARAFMQEIHQNRELMNLQR
jgi:hypothetical protein